jgi:hypothetical protein
VSCDAVTNNHFDEDGLAGVFAVIDPATANRFRARLIDVAAAGDFGVFKSRDAARITFAITALTSPETSPFPAAIFQAPYPKLAAELYVRMLDVFPPLIANPEAFQSYWEAEDHALSESEEMIKRQIVRIEELPDLDLAVVHTPDRSTVHPMAIHNATRATRILRIEGNRVEFQYRYESWVQFISRRPPERVDLSNLARELNLEEQNGGEWIFEGVDAITPRLRLTGKAESALPPSRIQQQLERHLRNGPGAWNPFDR